VNLRRDRSHAEAEQWCVAHQIKEGHFLYPFQRLSRSAEDGRRGLNVAASDGGISGLLLLPSTVGSSPPLGACAHNKKPPVAPRIPTADERPGPRGPNSPSTSSFSTTRYKNRVAPAPRHVRYRLDSTVPGNPLGSLDLSG
jgi:hypothetical protein